MSLHSYMDVHAPEAITLGLRARGVDVLIAQEDQAQELSDSDLLDRATSLRRVVFTQDDDLLTEASQRHHACRNCASVVFIHQQRLIISKCIRDLEILSRHSSDKALNHFFFLPLR